MDKGTMLNTLLASQRFCLELDRRMKDDVLVLHKLQLSPPADLCAAQIWV